MGWKQQGWNVSLYLSSPRFLCPFFPPSLSPLMTKALRCLTWFLTHCKVMKPAERMAERDICAEYVWVDVQGKWLMYTYMCVCVCVSIYLSSLCVCVSASPLPSSLGVWAPHRRVEWGSGGPGSAWRWPHRWSPPEHRAGWTHLSSDTSQLRSAGKKERFQPFSAIYMADIHRLI